MTTNTSIDVGSTSQTTLGTITTGTWNASTIGVSYGGTGLSSATSYELICGGTTSTGAFQSISSPTTNFFLQAQGSSSLPSWVQFIPTESGGTGSSGSGTYNNTVVCSGTSQSAQFQYVPNSSINPNGSVLTISSSGQLPLWQAVNTNILVANGILNANLGGAECLFLDPSVVTQRAFCIAATTANLSATYVGAGVGATLTNNSTQVAISIDGVSLSSGNRVLVKNQTTTLQNGIYTVTTVGSGSTNWVLTRAIDFDGSSTGLAIAGDTLWVQSGTVNGITQWMCTSVATIGTNPILFTQVSTQSQTLIDQTVPTIGTNPITTSNGSSTVTLTVSSTSNLQTGDSITVAGATATGGISGANLNVTSTITVVTSTTLTYTAGGVASSGATGGGAGVTATYTIVINAYNSYLSDSSSLVTFILPTTSNFGSTFTIIGSGSGGWKISQNSSQNIQFGSSNTTTGIGGSLASSNRYDTITLVCTVASTTWSVTSSIGNITVV